jgi:hypothetical protein
MVLPEAAPETLAQTPQEAWPFFAEDEIDAVTSVLRSGKVNQWTGHFVKDFQSAFTDWIGGGQRHCAGEWFAGAGASLARLWHRARR